MPPQDDARPPGTAPRPAPPHRRPGARPPNANGALPANGAPPPRPHGPTNQYTRQPPATTPLRTPYTREEAQRIQRQLNQVLGPEYVSFRPGGGGQNVSYIEGWKALNLANEIFGFNGWSSELVSVQVDFLDSHGLGRVSLGLSVVVRITIRDGTFHEDIGYGFIENAKTKAVAFEKCKKEAFTDGLKRCLRCFGNVLGNCLYDKGIVAKMQKFLLPVPELEHGDFHRDPLVAKREADRLRALAPPPMPMTAASSVTSVDTSVPSRLPSALRPQATPTAAKVPNSARAMTPVVVKAHELDGLDELFMFSDDMPIDDDLPNEKLDADLSTENFDDSFPNEEPGEDPLKTTPKPTPSQVFFTSSKKALDVQETPDQNGIPVYDHKFVSANMKRTVDPSKSVRVRRPDVPTAYTPSQINSSRMASPSVQPYALGKRPLGMPPAQKPPIKRLHKDIAEVANNS